MNPSHDKSIVFFEGGNYTTSLNSSCIPTIGNNNCFKIYINDSFGDGISNNGYYKLFSNNNTLVQGNRFSNYIIHYVKNGSLVSNCLESHISIKGKIRTNCDDKSPLTEIKVPSSLNEK